MYDLIDRRLAGLDHGARFLVLSMRLWVDAVGLAQCPVPAIAPVFARWRAIGALPHFHRAMALLSRDALETPRGRVLGCERVAEHEAVLLGVVRLLAARKPTAARDTIALMVLDDTVGDLLDALSQLAGALAAAGMLPARHWPTETSARD